MQRATARSPRATRKSLWAVSVGGTTHNPSSIGPFTGTFSDPPTQAEMQAFAAWGESLRQAQIR